MRRGRAVEVTRKQLDLMGGQAPSLLELAQASAAPSEPASAAMLRRVKKEMRDQKFENDLAELVLRLSVRGIPAPERELAFAAPDRGWRFDLAWPEVKLALEVDGGAYIGGRHTSGAGFQEDQVKRNAALLKGWRVLHILPRQLSSATTVTLITSAFAVIRTGEASPLPEEYRKCRSRK